MERAIDIDPAELHVDQSALLTAFPFVVHAATGRVPGLGRADGNLGYGGGRERNSLLLRTEGVMVGAL